MSGCLGLVFGFFSQQNNFTGAFVLILFLLFFFPPGSDSC